MKLSTGPNFCAKPVKSSTEAPWPSRCAAIVISAPTVMTPVPPTPVTSRLYGFCSAAGFGAGKHIRARQHIDVGTLLLAARSALDGDKTRAEAVDAGKILVAGREIDLALAAERRFLRLDAEAVGFHRAVAAALADEIVDVGEFRRIGQLAALSAAPLLGGAFLLIDQHGDADDLAQLALHGVELRRGDGT